MSATIAAAAIIYGVITTNTYDQQKFKEGSQPYQPTRITSCDYNEYGRPVNCKVITTGRFANPYATQLVQQERPQIPDQYSILPSSEAHKSQ